MDESLSGIDAAFWHLESPAAPLHLGALAVFEPPQAVEPTCLARLVRERAARIPRLRRKVVGAANPLAAPRWVEDAAFDAGRHVHVHHLDADGGALAGTAADLMAVPLNPHLPPWEIHVLAPAPRRPTGSDAGQAPGFALLLKLHHAAADGLRAVELAARLFDQYQQPLTGSRPPRGHDSGHAAPAGDGTPPPAPSALRRVGRLAQDPRPAADTLANRAEQMLWAARVATSVATESLHGALRPGPHPLHTLPTGRVGLALPQLPLDDVHCIRKEHGGTVNDVLLTVIAAALRTWLIERGHRPAPGLVRILVPVSSRRAVGPRTGGNQLSGYLLDLPVCHSDPLARLHAIHDAMNEHKRHGPRQGPGALPVLADLLPPLAQRLAAPLLQRSAPLLFDALVTNVPLPDVPISLAGAPLRALHPIAPLAHGHALAIATTTFRNTVHLGIHATDAADAEHLGQAAHTALAELLRASA